MIRQRVSLTRPAQIWRYVVTLQAESQGIDVNSFVKVGSGVLDFYEETGNRVLAGRTFLNIEER